MKRYKHWEILDVMPDGWAIDKTCGSPLAGHDFITNGKSVLNGQKRALLKAPIPAHQTETKEPAQIELQLPAVKESSTETFKQNTKTINTLAREKFKLKLLADIRTDMMICELEGWSKTEYLNDIKQLVGSL